MKLGIMQPYFFPYIGYWQLMNAVDTYVIYDDVTFIKNGWINRNRILINGEARYFNLPTVGASSYVLIKDVQLSTDRKSFEKLIKSLDSAYKKAAFYDETMPLLESIILSDYEYASGLLEFQIRSIAKHLGMNTNILLSSRDVEKNTDLRAQDKVLDICKNLHATVYYNAIGGTELYDKEIFAQNGIKLSFLATDQICYKQYKNEFVPYLSIIDVLMFNGVEETKQLLKCTDIP
ncbi:MAG: hypothetical protein E7048_09265 [Lentisphaerae bacterium]|nr:hypothetical protein [Lentisphaerota bacterium]